MSASDDVTVHMLREIDRKLDALIEKLSIRAEGKNSDQGAIVATPAEPLSECASKIAALTPKGARQTDTVELLRQDRSR